MSALYLLHLEPRYRHAGHYLGFTSKTVAGRLYEHLTVPSKASPLIPAAIAAGSEVTLTRTWPGGTRTLERQLKRQGGLSRHCPTCRARGVWHR